MFYIKYVVIVFMCFFLGACHTYTGPGSGSDDKEVYQGTDDDDDPDIGNTTAYTFYDKFNGTSLNSTLWRKGNRQWGGANGGVVPENVSVSNGVLVIAGYGDQYTGTVSGHGRDTRIGGVIVSQDRLGSGSYEVKMKVLPRLGACSTIWTFYYEEHYSGSTEYNNYINNGWQDQGGYITVNHEIDIELPGRPYDSSPDISFSHALFNNWLSEVGLYSSVPWKIGPQADGKWHIYRFDWHTGGNNTEKSVAYYIDGELELVTGANVPTYKGEFWIGVWFPAQGYAQTDYVGWAGNPDFDTDYMYVDWVRYTAFNDAGDEI
ncbi:MAG TPA: glycoside hydrolase family 16 protein [Spirochaetota bacterium]|nr:glycoside hydrolase family 16 protein [Spirochaetota bacterium]